MLSRELTARNLIPFYKSVVSLREDCGLLGWKFVFVYIYECMTLTSTTEKRQYYCKMLTCVIQRAFSKTNISNHLKFFGYYSHLETFRKIYLFDTSFFYFCQIAKFKSRNLAFQFLRNLVPAKISDNK